MLIVSSTLGSPTNTGWKRRASAASFSTCLRYSSSVVAPTQCSSPRASSGLSRLEASIAPSALAGADQRVHLVDEQDDLALGAARSPSARAFSRSSNSPRYLAPATIAPRSSAISRLPFSASGTSPLTMRRASPSTIAVLPTPGSPISTGLFLVRRASTWMVRRISSSRPITGSSLPSRASAVTSRAYFFSASKLASAFWLVTWRPLRMSATAFSSACGVAPALRSARAAAPSLAASASSSRSCATYSSPACSAAALRRVEHAHEARRRLRLAGAAAADLGLLGKLGFDGGTYRLVIAAGRTDQAGGRPFLVIQQRLEQMFGRQLRVKLADGDGLGGLDETARRAR